MRWGAHDRAVVLGGSIAGLLTARVLAEHYDCVTIVERDRLPTAAQHRRGVPHGRHFHGLLPHGQLVMEELLPGLSEGLIAAGALTGDVLGNVRWYLRGQLLRRATLNLGVLSASRPLIEATVRSRVLALPNVELRDGCSVCGLRLSPNRRRVTGVLVSGGRGDARTQGSGALPADLVVDATGRGSRTRRWLRELGYPPPMDRVKIDLWYASCLFAAPAAALGDDLMVVVARLPRHRRSGVMQLIEGSRITVTLAGIRGDRPPLDPGGFADYARSLPISDVAEVIRFGRPLTAPVAFHCPTYERHRYEQVAAFPAGLLPIGDAVCSFNPVYAEGMSAAARAALTLRDLLSRWDSGEVPTEPYFQAVSAILDAPWSLAVGHDVTAGADARSDVAPGSAGLPASPVPPEYQAQLELAAAHDVALAKAFVRVAALVDPPSTLLHPAVRRRVATHSSRVARRVR